MQGVSKGQNMKSLTTKKIARAGLIAGVYTLTAMITFPISSGAIQLRLSEALCVLPFLFIEAVPALFIGCMLSNIITACAFLDVILGSVITLVSAMLTYLTGKLIKNTVVKIIVGGLFPVLLNAFFLPLIWQWCYGFLDYIYIVQVGILVLGQAISVYLIGTPLYITIKKLQAKNVKFLSSDF